MPIDKSKMGSLFLRNLPRHIKDSFKASCARRGMTMLDRIIEMMREDIKKDSDIFKASKRYKKRNKDERNSGGVE